MHDNYYLLNRRPSIPFSFYKISHKKFSFYFLEAQFLSDKNTFK
jgi:hypothetical protein